MKLLTLSLAVATISAAGLALAYQPQPQTPPAGEQQRQGGIPDMGAKLIEGLKNSPGCLGAEAAQTQSGKNVIFAWFEDKAAAMAWYNSPTHSFMRKAFTDPSGEAREPMAHIPDDVPILTIASLKMGDKPLPGMRIAVSEIAIEMYTPLPGGIRFAGGFAPEALKVPHRLDLDAEGKPVGAAAEGEP
jgi:hypothetical protein